MVYEAMLLFGVLFIAGWLFSTLLQQRHALYLRAGLQLWLFFVLAIYFIWFWTHGGQTLAMKTWRIKAVDAQQGRPLSVQRALARYVLAWLWFIPGLSLAYFFGDSHWILISLPVANLLLWAATIYLDPKRQFLHDRLAGTRLIWTPPR